MKVEAMFDIIQGHQITDEELYIAEGNIPVLTGKNEIKGFWNKSLVEERDLPCITYPSKANAGDAYVQYAIFDANNTAVLVPKPEWRQRLNLEWVAFKLAGIFLDIPTSKEGVNYLNKAIVEEVDLDVPSRPVQDAELSAYEELSRMEHKLETILAKIKRLKKKPVVIP